MADDKNESTDQAESTDPQIETVSDLKSSSPASSPNSLSSDGIDNDLTSVKDTATDTATDAETDSDKKDNQEAASDSPRRTFTQLRVSKILDDVLDEQKEIEESPQKSRHPLLLDIALGLGLLVAVGAFTVGLFHMYLAHSATQSIIGKNYKAAIHMLKGAPFPEIFNMPGTETGDLLPQALYLDAVEKIDSGAKLDEALKELSEIRPGSKYFALAQELIEDNTEPAPMYLEGGTEHQEASPQVEQNATPILDSVRKSE